VTLHAGCRATRGEFVLDVTLDVGDGELCALVGPNGAGKSTLLRVLAGLVPIDAGKIEIDGTVVDDADQGVFVPPENRSVGVVFQDYLLFPHLSAVDNIAFGLRERGLSKRDARVRASEYLARVNLADRASAKPAQLSGGEAQRVALARALAIEPALLLMDEPLAALDVQHRGEMRRDLRAVLAAFTGARLLVTHDPVDALSLADRLCIMQEGRIVQEGAPADIIARPRSQYVADLVGVNLYRGVARGTQIALDGAQAITVADEHDGDVLAVVAPHAVVLHAREPEGSARNVWRGAVDGIERFGDRVRVHVDGPLSIVAEVTPGAVDALALGPGVEVWAAVKATEVDVYPA
jgi:molybdate transport system ATP-binding protein